VTATPAPVPSDDTATAAPVPDITGFIADELAGRTFDALPESVVGLARMCLMDWIAVAIAGASDESVRLLLAEIMEQGGHPKATFIGSDARGSTLQAALVNGMASHVHDYDDVSLVMSSHPSVVLLPGLLALAAAWSDALRRWLPQHGHGRRLRCDRRLQPAARA
jgi:2-methylcitrate dehydratase PrpD